MPADLISYVAENAKRVDTFEEARRQIRDQTLYPSPQPLLKPEEIITLILLLTIFIPIAYLLGVQYVAALPNIPKL